MRWRGSVLQRTDQPVGAGAPGTGDHLEAEERMRGNVIINIKHNQGYLITVIEHIPFLTLPLELGTPCLDDTTNDSHGSCNTKMTKISIKHPFKSLTGFHTTALIESGLPHTVPCAVAQSHRPSARGRQRLCSTSFHQDAPPVSDGEITVVGYFTQGLKKVRLMSEQTLVATTGCVISMNMIMQGRLVQMQLSLKLPLNNIRKYKNVFNLHHPTN